MPGDVRRDLLDGLVKAAILGLPTLLLNMAFKSLAERLFGQPWQAVWVIAPLAVAAWIAWRALAPTPSFRLSGPFAVFFVAYVLAFSLAASVGFLDWNRTVVVPGQTVERSWLTPNAAGDWRYWLMPNLAPAQDLVVVYTDEPAGLGLAERRIQFMNLIALAGREEATGIGFDFYLEGDSAVDRALCSVIKRAHVPVVFGIAWTNDADSKKPPSALKDCGITWGHLAGIRDADLAVRSIPLQLWDKTPAVSLVVAQALDPKLPKPGDDVLRLPPWTTPLGARATYKELLDGSRVEKLYRRFVLVGVDSKRETIDTRLWTTKKGVEIHAAAAQALRTGRFVQRAPWALGFLAILVVCYLVTALAAAGHTPRTLALVCAIASVAVLIASALAARFALLWIDVVYPLVAIWLLLPLAIVLRARIASRAAKEQAPTAVPGDAARSRE